MLSAAIAVAAACPVPRWHWPATGHAYLTSSIHHIMQYAPQQVKTQQKMREVLQQYTVLPLSGTCIWRQDYVQALVYACITRLTAWFLA